MGMALRSSSVNSSQVERKKNRVVGKIRRTYKYVRTVEDFEQAVKIIRSYLQQGTENNRPLLAVDCETYFKNESFYEIRKIPRAIWLSDEEEWEGYIRTIQIGLDPTVPDYIFKNVQFVIDVKEIGELHIAAALKDILENNTLVMANAKYDTGFIKAHLDIEIGVKKNIIDTMLISQALFAGDRIRHSLGDQYKEYMGRTAPGLFEDLTGYTFGEYVKLKKRLQKMRWNKELTKEQIKYAAEDVQLIFYVVESQCDLIDQFVKQYERGFRENQGLEHVLSKIELPLIPMFSDMEQNGLLFDREYHENYVIPLLEDKLWEAQQSCAIFPEFREKADPTGRKNITYIWSGKDTDRYKSDCKAIKRLVKAVHKDCLDVKVNTKKTSAIKEMTVSWIGGQPRSIVRSLVSSFISKYGNEYKYRRSLTINFSARELMKERLALILGHKIENSQAKYLKTLIDPKNPKTKAVEYVMRWLKTKSMQSKYGANFLRFLTPRNMIHVNWKQIGAEATGRTSCSEPNIMQMAARDMLFGWSSTGSISASELFRSSWIAEEGCVLIDFDYSAIEPRITAQRTKDKTLISIFCEGKDMHMMTGMAALNLTEVPEKGTEEFEYVRNIVGKIVNLGLGYGMGARGLAEFLYDKTNGLIDYRADISKAQVIIDRYFELYEGVLRKIEWAEDKATKKLKEAGTLAAFRNRRPFGVVHSIEGRPRRFCIMKEHEDSSIFSLEELREDYNPTEKRHYYNEFRRRVNKVRLAAYNSLIQSSAADMLKRAELSVWRKLRKMYASGEFDPRFEHVKLVLHDEILVQARKENAAKMARLVYDSMMEEGQKILKVVPTVVDGGMGYSWHSAKKSKLDFTSSATLLACVQESLSMLDEQREYNKRRTAA